jgi:hypothetical protein
MGDREGAEAKSAKKVRTRTSGNNAPRAICGRMRGILGAVAGVRPATTDHHAA